jgi:hypothetical protein
LLVVRGEVPCKALCFRLAITAITQCVFFAPPALTIQKSTLPDRLTLIGQVLLFRPG